MNYQFEFDFETPEDKEKRFKGYVDQQEKIDKMFDKDSDNYYFYNKYVDGFIDLLPYRLGWGFKHNWFDLRWWIKCKYQKIRYGISDDDVYNLEVNIAKYIVPRLKYLRNKGKIGIPVKFLPSNYSNLSEEDTKKAEEIGEKEMNYIIDEMIFAFDYIINPDKYLPYPVILFKERNYFNREKTLEEKICLDKYVQESKEFEARKKNGLILFAEHSDILWL